MRTCGWPGEAMVEGLRVAALEAVVELLADRARELVDELARVDEVERAHPLAREPRGLVEEGEVGLDLARGVRPLHLDRDARGRSEASPGAPGRSTRRRPGVSSNSVKSCSIERPRSSRITRSTSSYGKGRTSSWSDWSSTRMSGGTMSGRVESSWPNLTKVGPSSSSSSRRCWPRCEGDAFGHGPRLPAGQQVGQAMGLEEVAEAVPDRDLEDLGEAPEVPRGGARHAFSVASAEDERAGATGTRRPRCLARIQLPRLASSIEKTWRQWALRGLNRHTFVTLATARSVRARGQSPALNLWP